MSTLTSNLETVPWISPDYFAYNFPEHTKRNAVYYLGFTLVHPHRRQTRIFQAMISRVVEVLVADKAVCAWDICSHNDISLSLQDNIERLSTAAPTSPWRRSTGRPTTPARSAARPSTDAPARTRTLQPVRRYDRAGPHPGGLGGHAHSPDRRRR